MPEYIEREALTIENIEKYMTVMEVNTKEYGQQVVVAVDDLMYLPSADVVKVRHGEWIVEVEYETALSGSRINKIKTYHCPYCKKRFRQKMKFCGDCGAKMDGKGD